jgi:hypothetical protein
MRRVYRYLAMAVATGVILQAASIAWAYFALSSDVEAGTVIDQSYEDGTGLALHSVLGWMVIPALALALLVVGIILRKLPRALLWAGIVFGLVLLQGGLAEASFDAPVLGLLHGTNAVLILLASLKAIYVVPKAAVPAEV